MKKISAIFIKHWDQILFVIPAGCTRDIRKNTRDFGNCLFPLSCPEAARIILSCKEPVRFLEEEDDLEDDFEEFDFMMFSQLEDTRDVLFSILQDRSLPPRLSECRHPNS